MECEHNYRVGDKYGISCRTCGEILEGFGLGGWLGREHCIHKYHSINAIEEQCDWCGDIRRKKNVN